MRYLALALMLMSSVATAATPVIEQTSGMITASSLTETHTVTGVTAGNTLALVMMQRTAAIRTFAFADDTNGAWTVAQATDPSGSYTAAVAYYLNSAGGDIDVTITMSGGSFQLYEWEVMEISNADTVDIAAAAGNYTSTNSPAFFPTPVTMAADSIAIGCMRATASSVYTAPTGASWAGLGWTIVAYYDGFVSINSSAVTSHSGTVSATNLRNHVYARVVLKDSGGGGGVAVDPLSKAITGSPTAINPIPVGF